MNSARWLRRRPKAIHVVVALSFVPWLVLLGWLASVAWFITDDAFISFRYARNLLEGHGLVFNPGEYVEGYTNFLWVLELAAIWGLLGIRPEDAAQWLSVIYTAGTIVVMLWWVARMPALRHRWLVAWMALGLVCSSATFAVWTSGGGLETRQFTFFALTAVVCLSVFGQSRWGLLAASLSLAAAALTRPEGLLLAACGVGWFVGHRLLTAHRLDWRGTLALAGPFAVLIGGHFLARYRYYGEWLPNTYYAKHVGPWYESGFRYLWAAAIETGLYLLIPLTYVALRTRWREHRDGLPALALLCVGTHMAYILQIGGDYFEFRPLDFYWPLLAVPTAAGIAQLSATISASVRPLFRNFWYPRTWSYSIAIFVPLLFYSSAIQGVLLLEGDARYETFTPNDVQRLYVVLDDKNSRWLLAAPAMPALVAISNDLRRQSSRQYVGVHFPEHRSIGDGLVGTWKPYERSARGVIPVDARMALRTVGILPYYVPDLKIVDKLGLTDVAIARNPVEHSNDERLSAHDRSPPRGYLQQRGVNFRLHPAAAREDEALSRGNYALRVGPSLWMPFDVADHEWANARFDVSELRAVNRYSQTDPTGNRIFVDGVHFVGERFLGRFENSLDGWWLEGKAVSNNSELSYPRAGEPIFGHVGPGYLSSYWPGKWERTGRALSPKFAARGDQYLMFLLAGISSDLVGFRLLADGKEAAVWRGNNTRQFDVIVYPLEEVAEKQLQLEIFNNEIGDYPRLLLDHVMLVRKASIGGH